MKLISQLFNFVSLTTKQYLIDESHGLSHSMDVLHYANLIYKSELPLNPYLQNQERVIYTSAIVHDMCDKKYMNETEGIIHIDSFLQDKILPEEVHITKKIISTMSYSTVKKNGFPDLGNYQLAYHIVREADLLSAFDFERSVIYNLQQMNGDISIAYNNAKQLFENRMFKHNEDGLYITEYSKKRHNQLKKEALKKMKFWKQIMDSINE